MIEANITCELLEIHGKCQPQDAAEWTGDIPLPVDIADFYREVGPINITIKGYGNPIFIPRLSQLWSHQAGYRWNGLTEEPIADWDINWIVVADEGGDPYIHWHDRVLFCHHGEGAWDPVELYPDLNTMAACMATLGSVVLSAGDQLTDDQYNINPAFRQRAVSQLTELLGDSNQAVVILEMAGWG